MFRVIAEVVELADTPSTCIALAILYVRGYIVPPFRAGSNVANGATSGWGAARLEWCLPSDIPFRKLLSTPTECCAGRRCRLQDWHRRRRAWRRRNQTARGWRGRRVRR